jgi:hypothetical protein
MALYSEGGEGRPIPFVKVYGELVVAPAPTVWVGDDVFLYVELINMGTAPSNDGDALTGSLVFEHTVLHQESVSFPVRDERHHAPIRTVIPSDRPPQTTGGAASRPSRTTVLRHQIVAGHAAVCCRRL